MHYPTDRIAYTTAFVVEHWLEWEKVIKSTMRDWSDNLLSTITTKLHLVPKHECNLVQIGNKTAAEQS